MSAILLFLGIGLIVISIGGTGKAYEMRRLGFTAEANEVLKISMACAVIGFVLFTIAQPHLVFPLDVVPYP